MEDLKHEDGEKDYITELKSLIRGHRIESNRLVTQKFRVLYRWELRKRRFTEKRRNTTRIFKIGKIKKAISDFAKQANKEELESKEYKERNNRKFGKLETRDINLHFPRGGINDFEDGDSTVFRMGSEQRNGEVQEELQKEIEGNAYTVSTYGEDNGGWKESNAKLGERSEN